MKPKNVLLYVCSVLIVASMLLSACAPAPTAEAPAPAQPEATEAEPAPAEPTEVKPIEPPATQAPAKTEAPAPTEAPAETEAAMDKQGGQLVMAETDGYYTLDPFITPWHDTPQYAVYDTLLAIKPDLSAYEGYLVEDGWEIAPDNLSVTFKVRPGIKYTDGEPVTAESIKWVLDHFRAEETGSPGGGWMQGIIKDVQAPDESTLVINLESPYAPLFFQLSANEMPSPKAYQELGPDAFAQTPVGSGPWMVKEIVPEASILYTRNPDYAWPSSWFENKGPAYPDEFLIKYMTDEAVTFASLEAGEIHIAPIPPQFLEQAQADPNIEIVKGQEAGGTYLGFNTEFAPFDNPNVRLALSHAINRDELIQVGFEGEAVPMYTNMANTEMGWSKEVEEKAMEGAYDPEMTKSMLEAEGFTLGSDGVYEKDGVKMEYTFTVPTGDAEKRVAEVIQAQLAEVGVKANIDIKEPQVIRDMTVEGSHQMILWYFGLLDPQILYYLYHSDRIGASNRTRYNNPDLDKVLEEADAALDWEVRKQKVAEALQILVDNRPNIPLYSTLSYTGFRKDLIDGVIWDALGGILIQDIFMLEK
jgi:peptide/nickel transport system substrate-binding protein